MSETGEPKIRVTIGLTSRTVTAMNAEAKRLGITFSDQARRITDNWVDARARSQEKPVERIVVLDGHGVLHPTR